MNRIIISVGDTALQAELNDTPTARQVWEVLPIEGRANVWGDEIYFEIPVKASLESDAREDVEVGELGYWPVGGAFCIFYGPTPVSRGDKPRAYSPVNILGRVLDDATQLMGTPQGIQVRITRADNG